MNHVTLMTVEQVRRIADECTIRDAAEVMLWGDDGDLRVDLLDEHEANIITMVLARNGDDQGEE